MLNIVQNMIFLGIVTLLAWVWFQLQFHRLLKAASNLPSALPTTLFFGHLHLCFHGLRDATDILIQKGRKVLERGIRNCIFWFGPYPIFMILDANDVQLVLTSSKTAEKGIAYKFMNFALGNGLISSSGKVHKVTRRHLNPLFQLRNLEQLLPVFNASSRHLVRDLSEHVGTGLVDVQHACDSFSFISICSIIFGPDEPIDPTSEEFQNVMRSGKRISRLMLNRLFKIWLWPDCIFYHFWRKEVDQILNGWRSFSDKLLGEGSKMVDDSFCNKEHRLSEEEEEYTPKHLTLPIAYKLLQQKQPQFTETDLLHEMITLVIAGTDTTKISIASCLLSLAACPEIQEKLYEEILSVVGIKERDLTLEDFQKMPYLDQVFKETLRKYHVIPMILRSVKEDIKLSDVTLPEGSTIGVVLFGLHFNPDVYPDPEKFDPERYSPKNIHRTEKYFLPFSAGSRSCIGSLYAVILFKMAVVHVVRRFRLSSNVDITQLRYKGAIAMVTKSGYKLHLQHREL